MKKLYAGRADPMACDSEVNEATSVPEHWLAAFPFGGDGDKDCKSYREEMRHERTSGQS